LFVFALHDESNAPAIGGERDIAHHIEGPEIIISKFAQRCHEHIPLLNNQDDYRWQNTRAGIPDYITDTTMASPQEAIVATPMLLDTIYRADALIHGNKLFGKRLQSLPVATSLSASASTPRLPFCKDGSKLDALKLVATDIPVKSSKVSGSSRRKCPSRFQGTSARRTFCAGTSCAR